MKVLPSITNLAESFLIKYGNSRKVSLKMKTYNKSRGNQIVYHTITLHEIYFHKLSFFLYNNSNLEKLGQKLNLKKLEFTQELITK